MHNASSRYFKALWSALLLGMALAIPVAQARTGGPLTSNGVPKASPDAVTVKSNSERNTIDVLANDFDPDGDSLSLTISTLPSNGVASIEGRVVQYTPNPDFHGTDTFTYKIEDGKGEEDVTVQGDQPT